MRTRRHKLQVSTFPFLAVLLCAMGALLLVLLVMDRRAHDASRFRAAQAVRHAAEETDREVEARRSALEQRRQEAHAARQQVYEAAHARLAGQEVEVRKEIRLVRDELARAAERLRAEQGDETALKQKIESEHTRAGEEEQSLVRVRAEEATKAAQSESSRKAQEQMTAELARLEQALADLKAARQKEEKTYSVVPYNGKRGENRRPIYVECAAGQVIFHPDRAPLDEPLSAPALQSEVERRLARQKEQLPPAQAVGFTPYLMLLIRPDGVSTYYRFREALQGRKIDFGYEVVDKDWVLDFPADDQDSPSPAWTTVAKPSSADSSAPPTDAPSQRLRGVASGQGREGSAAAPNPEGGLPGLPPPPPPPASDMANSSEPGGVSPKGPGGKGSGGTDIGSGGPLLIEPLPDASPKPAVAGSSVAPRLFAPGGAPRDGVVAGANGPPDSGAPTDEPKQPPSEPGQPAPTEPGQGAGKAGPATAKTLVAKHSSAGSWATQGTQAAAGSAGPGATSATAPAPGSTDVAKNPAPAPQGAGSTTTGGSKTASAERPDDDPFLRSPPSPPLPNKTHQPPALRPARLSGDRDWILYVECKPEGVVIYPSQMLVPLAALNRPSGSNPLLQAVQQLIDRKQATVRRGEMPFRPEVRFLVRPDAARTYHLAYPTLDGLAAPKTSQNLGPDDDVSAVVAGH